MTRSIRDASDIVAVISQYVALKPAGRDFKGLCPFHKEKTPSFHVRVAEQYFKCFGCGKGGDVFTFMMEINSVDFPEARRILADRAGIQLGPSDSGPEQGVSRSSIIRTNAWAARVYQQALRSPAGQAARKHLENRGISQEIAQRFMIGYAANSYDFLLPRARQQGLSEQALLAAGLLKKRPDGGCYDVFRNRLMFPIVDPAARVIGFGGRALGDEPAKYINTAETAVFNKRACLYGIHQSREAFSESQQALVVEGYTDVLMAHQQGYRTAVATLGTALTEEHAGILRRYVPRIILVFDGDEAGFRAAERGIEIALRAEVEVLLAQLPEGLDPCDFLTERPQAAFEDLLNSAPTALEFKWQQVLRQQRSGTTPTGRLQAVREFIAFLASLPSFGALDSIHRGMVIHQLASLVNASAQEVSEQIRLARRQLSPGPKRQIRGERPSAPPVGARPRDFEEAAMKDILAVLLCQPDLHPRAAEVYEPRYFTDERLRRVARTVGECIGEIDGFSGLLDRFEDPDDVSLIVALHESGRAGGAHMERLDAAVRRLQSMGVVRAARQVSRDLRTAADRPAEPAACDGKLAELHRHTREYASGANFAGIGKLRSDAVE